MRTMDQNCPSRRAILLCTLGVSGRFGRVEQFERKRQRTAALQDASARHAVRILPRGFGVRLSSAAFPHGEYWRVNNLAAVVLPANDYSSSFISCYDSKI